MRPGAAGCRVLRIRRLAMRQPSHLCAAPPIVGLCWFCLKLPVCARLQLGTEQSTACRISRHMPRPHVGGSLPVFVPAVPYIFSARVVRSVIDPMSSIDVETRWQHALPTFSERKRGVPKRMLDNRMPRGTVVSVRGRRCAVILFL